jgi:hypothetical protein
MSIFAHTITNEVSQKVIYEFLKWPSLKLWNEIANIHVTKQHSLWGAAVLLKPRYIFEYDRTGGWKTFPDSITLSRAIKCAVKYQESIKEDMSFWPGPKAA